jgi:colanic acid/amylovoran biosynthesis glycosyltransferase
MRLAYISSLYGRASDTFVRREVIELRARGHAVHTFSIREPDESELVSDAVRDEHARTDYILSHGPGQFLAALARTALRKPATLARTFALASRLATPGARGRLWPYAYLLEATYLAERLEALGVQHLHDHIVEGSASVAMLASGLSGVPFSVTAHGPGEFDRPGALALETKLARAAFFVAPAEYTRAQLMRWSRPEDWPRIRLVRSGVERGLLERPVQPFPHEPRFVSIGRLDVDKGQSVLLEAVSLLRQRGQDAVVTVVGEGPLRDMLERAATQMDVADRVHFPGWLAFDDVLELIEGSRAIVMPSLAEGLPNVLTEALAVGRPAVASAVAGVGELVQSDATGWLVPAGSPEALAAALSAAATADVAELERMGENGRRAVRERHDTSREVAKLEALFLASAERSG